MSTPLHTSSRFKQFLKNKGAVLGSIFILFVIIAALFAHLFYPTDPLRMVATPEIWPFQTWKYPLGTDSMGRDIAAMIIHGARATLMIGLSASITATVIGLVVGAIAGWLGGWTDEILMRIAELFSIIPNVVFILTIVSLLGPDIWHVTFAVGLVSWPPIARLTRAQFMTFKEREFVLASRSIGETNLRIIWQDLLPNALPPVIVLSSMIVAGAILYESVISFLGLGDPNIASWGRLIGEGRSLIRSSWYICAIPGIAIMLTVLSLNLIGDGLNDALNPKLRQ